MRFDLVGPTKVIAGKSFLFTEKFSCIENKEHFVEFAITFMLLSLCFNVFILTIQKVLAPCKLVQLQYYTDTNYPFSLRHIPPTT